MADLKTLKIRINSVKQTQKITKAMKMVAASKLRKAREAAEESRSYSEGFADLLSSHISAGDITDTRSIIYGSQNPKNILLVIVTSDRGLCGGLNANLIRYILKKINTLEEEGYQVKLWCVGKKGHSQLTAQCADYVIGYQDGYSSNKIIYKDAENLSNKLVELFLAEKIDICEVIYPKFKSAITQEVTRERLFPCEVSGKNSNIEDIQFEYEPKKGELLENIVTKNIAVQLFQSFMETYASEQGARMSAMDNAVNNCTELVGKLNLLYNRTRQAKITTELIEIISASESI